MAAIYALPTPDPRAVRAVNSEDKPIYDGQALEGQASFVMTDREAGRTIAATLGPSHFTVYWDLCNRATDGICWPSLDTIAEDCKVSRMTVTRVLNDLEAGEWVKRTQRFNEFGMATSTQYEIVHIAGRMVRKPDDSGCNTTVTTHEHRVNIDPSKLLHELEENKTLTKPEPERVVNPPTPVDPPKENSKPIKRKHRMPEDFGLNPERLAYALEHGMTEPEAADLLEDMRLWSHGKGGMYEEWDLAWKSWVRKHARERPRAAKAPPTPIRTDQAATNLDKILAIARRPS